MSSATIHPDARSACRTQLNGASGLPAAHAYEGFSYEPTVGTPFVEDKLVANGSPARANGAIEHRMSYIVTLKYPSNKGTAGIEAMAGVILDRFKVGSKFTYGASTVTSMGAERRGGIVQEPEWLILTVMVTLVAFTLE